MSEPAATPSPSPWRFAVRRLVRHKLPFGLALFWSVVFVLVPMQVPVITGALLDNLKSKHVRLYGFDLSPGSRRRSIEIAALALMAVAAARGLSAYLRQLSVNKLTQGFVCELRRDLIRRLTMMPLEYHCRIGAGDLFDAATIGRMAEHLERLLVEMVKKPEARLSELDILSQDEIVAVDPPGDDFDEAPHLPRVLLWFNRIHFGRLRQMIDALNQY